MKTYTVYAHIRIYDPSISRDLRTLASAAHRTPNAEAMIAIETHLEANRALLKSGPKRRKEGK